MNRIKRLQTLIDVAKNHENQAARALGECQGRLAEQSARLEELKSYRHEYVSQIQHLGRSGMAIETVHRYQQFVQRLDETIRMQTALIGQIQRECQDRRHAWSQARVRHKSLDRAAARHRVMETRRRDRREQQHSDEHVLARLCPTDEEAD